MPTLGNRFLNVKQCHRLLEEDVLDRFLRSNKCHQQLLVSMILNPRQINSNMFL